MTLNKIKELSKFKVKDTTEEQVKGILNLIKVKELK